MMVKSKIINLIVMIFSLFFLFSCDDRTETKKALPPAVISGEITQPVIKKPPPKVEEKKETDQKPVQKIVVETNPQILAQETEEETEEETPAHYDSKGKVDPFKPLIQETPEEAIPDKDDKPKRILTPLEKIELSQVRLVAVIILKNRRIAMVEEANGKGYEVRIGTYIGKNQGRVSEINKSSIAITELVKDYMGKLKEQVQEIKLHKIDDEE